MALTLVYITLLGFIPYLILVWRAPELRWSRVRSTILTFAVLFRLAMLALPVPLSKDTARYLWDGRIQVHGFNPYKHSPDDPSLAHLRDANWEQLDHRDAQSVYPPVLLLLFRLVAWLAPSGMTFRVLFLIFDMLTFRLLVRLLRARGQNESLALIWAFNPLVILEFAGCGQEMSLAIMFFIAGLWMLQQRLTPLAALAFGLATLSHLLALPLAIMILAAARIWSLRIWLWYALPVTIGYLLFAGAGMDLVTGLMHMGGHQPFNGSLYELLAPVFDPTGPHHHGSVWAAHTKIVTSILVAALFVGLFRQRVRPVYATLTLAGGILLVSSTVHPWYVAWLVALGTVEFSLPWLMFSACVLVSYVARITQIQTGIWVDAAFTRWLEYWPVYLLLGSELWRKRFDSAPIDQ